MAAEDSGRSEASDLQEFEDRMVRVREAMQAAGYQGLLLGEDTSSLGEGNTRYLTGFGVPGASPGGRHVALLIPAHADPTLVVPAGWFGAGLELARRHSVIADVRADVDLDSPYGARLHKGVVAAVRDAGLERAQIGVCGTFPELPHVFAALPSADFVTASDNADIYQGNIVHDLIAPVRAQKSAWELERLAKARELGVLAAQALQDAAQVGTSVHLAVAKARAAGCVAGHEDMTTFSVYLGGGDPWNFAEDGGVDRLFREGELVTYELNNRVDGYFTQYPGCFTIGEPNVLQEKVIRVATESNEAVREAIVPGTTGGELWDVGIEVVEAAGLKAWGQFGHGMGLGMAEGLRIWPGDTGGFVERSTFVLHSAVVDPDRQAFALVGDVCVLLDGSARPLTADLVPTAVLSPS